MNAEVMKPEAVDIAQRVSPLLKRAKGTYAHIEELEQRMHETRDELLMESYRLGEALAEMKAIVGHGRWLFWLGANWAQLSARNAQRCIALFRENPKCADSAHLTEDSIRKFLWHYVPEKSRGELPGNETINRPPHQLGFVNQFFKWDRRIQKGLDPAPPVETLRQDLEPAVRRMVELVGREWILSIV